jgi:anti-sigma-K factor RskA
VCSGPSAGFGYPGGGPVSTATAYLLGELDPAEAAAFERAMAADAALRDEVERLRPVVTRLQRLPHDAWDAPEPPPLVMPADAVGRANGATARDAAPAPHDVAPGDAASPRQADPRDASSDDVASPRRDDPRAASPRRRRARGRRLVLRPAFAVLGAVALVAAGAGLGFVLDREPSPAAQLALRPVGGLDPAASGKVSLVGHGVDVRVSGLKPTGGGEFYELWLLGADKRLVGLGSFRVDEQGRATLKLPLPVDPKAFTYFDLSLEPSDGNPGHSGVSVLRGPSAA